MEFEGRVVGSAGVGKEFLCPGYSRMRQPSGIELLSEGSNRREELNEGLTNTIRPMFDQRVLPTSRKPPSPGMYV
jgi:hypothetical protein